MAETAQAAPASSQAPATDSRPVYEVGFHLVPALGDDGVPGALDKVRTAIGKDAEIISEGFPSKMTLAYTMERAESGKREKFAESYFGWVKFALPAEGTGELVGAIEQALRTDKNILRYLLIETVREDLLQQKSRATFQSDRLEGQTLTKAPREAEKAVEVSEVELDKSIEALTKE